MTQHVQAPIPMSLLERAGTIAGLIIAGLVVAALLFAEPEPPRPPDDRPDPQA